MIIDKCVDNSTELMRDKTCPRNQDVLRIDKCVAALKEKIEGDEKFINVLDKGVLLMSTKLQTLEERLDNNFKYATQRIDTTQTNIEKLRDSVLGSEGSVAHSHHVREKEDIKIVTDMKEKFAEVHTLIKDKEKNKMDWLSLLLAAAAVLIALYK